VVGGYHTLNRIAHESEAIYALLISSRTRGQPICPSVGNFLSLIWIARTTSSGSLR
jgi:hypothetical protein